jgi:hypothetical protein
MALALALHFSFSASLFFHAIEHTYRVLYPQHPGISSPRNKSNLLSLCGATLRRRDISALHVSFRFLFPRNCAIACERASRGNKRITEDE